MDRCSIERGTLLNMPHIQTFENPQAQSYNSLFDVSTCANIEFEILLDPAKPGDLYTRGARMDEDSTALLLALGRAYQDKNNNNNKAGFRVTLKGTLQTLGSKAVPPTIKLQEIDEFAQGCNDDDKTNITNVSRIMTGTDADTTPAYSVVGQKSFNRAAKIHGSLMMIGWGWLIPTGTIVAKFFRLENPKWLRFHQICQTLGLVLSTCGLAIALINFDAFRQKGSVGYYHAIMGITVMMIGIVQAMNAIFRPHLPTGFEEEKSTKRIIWEYAHKTLGWVSLPLAFMTIGLGTTLLPIGSQITFQVVNVIVLLLIGILFSQTKKKYIRLAGDDSDGISLPCLL